MKKVLSVLLALCITLMTGITAFAAEAPSSEKVMEQIEGAAAYLTNGVESYGVDEAMDFCILIESGADMSKYEKAFIADVKANLDANEGKIVSEKYGENLEVYAAVIISLLNLGEDTTDFNGYNIEKAFMALDPTMAPYSPNYYRIIAEAAFYCDDGEDFLGKICDTYISNYYTMGKGADYYGFSCDNTACFIDAISYGWMLLDKYEDVLTDAFKVLETYKVDGGYCFAPEYGTEPNADSTALALMAYCAYYPALFSAFNEIENIEDEDEFMEAYMAALNAHFDTVNSIYADLCTFESSEIGVFTYGNEDGEYDDASIKISTKDALVGLSYYYIEAAVQEMDFDDLDEPLDYEDEKTTVKSDTAETTTAATETTKADTSKKSPNTGSDVTVICTSVALCAAAGVLAILKKKEK